MSDMGTNVDVAANIEMNASGNLGTAVQEVAGYTDELTKLIAKYERWLNLQAKAAASGKNTSYYDSRINNLAQEIARKTAEAEAAEKKLQVRLTELNKAQKTTKNMNFGREVERRETLTPSQIALNEARAERYKYLSEEADRVKRNRNLNRKLQYADNMGKILGGYKDPAGIISGAGKAVSSAATFVKTLSGPTGKLGAAAELAAKGIQKLYNASQEAFQSVEVIKTSLSVITGSDTSGEALFRNISEFAVKSPFGVQQTSEQATLLRQSGVYNIDLMDKLKEIGDLAGGNSERMQRISNDYAQIMANGKATAIQLRQLGMAGIPIYKELSKELGVGTAEVRQMSKNGEISSEVIDRVFKNLTSEGGTFYQSVEKGSKTIKARTTNLEDAKTLAFAELGEWFNKWGTGKDNKTNLSALIGLEEAIYNKMNDWLGKINNNLDYNNLLKNQRAIEEVEVSVKSLEKRKEWGEFVDFELEYERERLAKLKGAYTDDQKISIEYARFSDLFKPLIEKEEKREALGGRLDEYNAKHRALNEKLESEEDFDNWYELNKQAINLGLAIDSLSNEFEGLGSDIETLKENLTSDLQRAGFFVNFKNLQENSAEYLEKAASKSGSLGDFTSQMEALYKQTDKYKKEQEELQKKNFEHTKEMARILSGKLDDEGFLNVNKISSASEFRELMSLMSPENKLDPKNRKDFEEINRRIDTAVRLAESDTTINKGNKEYIDLMNQLSGLKGLEGNALYNAFNRFSEAIKNISDGSTAELFNQIVGPLLTYRISGNTKALDFDLSDLDKGKTIEPLWKRILGNGLGLDPSKITSGVGALQTHETEQYTRNVSKSVLQSALRGGADTTQMMAMLSRTGQYKTDKYDPAKERVQQIDWKRTSANLKEFALRLGQAADVTSAYRQSVEDEVNTLADLLASMPTTFEDAANADNFKEQFLNVYKGSVDYRGQEAYVDATNNAVYVSGQLVGKLSDLKDQLQINEKTIEEANRQLEQRRKDLVEARKAEITNANLSDTRAEFTKSAADLLAQTVFGAKPGSLMYRELTSQTEYARANVTWDTYGEPKMNDVQRAKYDEAVKNNSEAQEAYSKAKERYDKYISERPKAAGYGESYFSKLRGDDKYIYSNLRNAEKELAATTNLLSEVKKNILDENGIATAASLNDAVEKMAEVGSARDGLVYAIDEETKALNELISVMEEQQRLGSLNSLADSGDYSGWFRDRRSMLMYGRDSGTMQRLYGSQSFTVLGRLKAGNEIYGNEINRLNALMGDGTGSKLANLYNQGKAGSDEWNELVEALTNAQTKADRFKETMDGLRDSASDLMDSFATDIITKNFETAGKSIRDVMAGVNDGADAWKDFGDSFVDMTKSLTANMAELFVTAGLEQLISNPKDKKGWLLLAAGGLSGILSGMLNSDSDRDDTDEQERKLQKLRDDLKDLLAQAKADAQYYETTLSHQKALSVNTSYSKVNDAIITPNGNVISTHPDDYLIATKTPQSLVGGGKQAVTFSPSIVVNNNTGRAVSVTPSYNPATNSLRLDLEELVTGIVNKGLADGSFEGGMRAREQNNMGLSVYQ